MESKYPHTLPPCKTAFSHAAVVLDACLNEGITDIFASGVHHRWMEAESCTYSPSIDIFLDLGNLSSSISNRNLTYMCF